VFADVSIADQQKPPIISAKMPRLGKSELAVMSLIISQASFARLFELGQPEAFVAVPEGD